eukprot:1467017-Amphidinium_carterae.1
MSVLVAAGATEIDYRLIPEAFDLQLSFSHQLYGYSNAATGHLFEDTMEPGLANCNARARHASYHHYFSTASRPRKASTVITRYC